METIVHISLTLNNAFKFMPDMGLHYQTAGEFEADAHLIGSATAKTGAEMEMSPEKDSDFEKPNREGVPYAVIVDTKGALKGMLHIFRRFELLRDVIVLVSEKTPQDYLKHLEERNYDFQVAGKERVDFKKAFEILEKEYGMKRILVDSGGILASLLINQKLVDKVSVLIHPQLVGGNPDGFFKNIEGQVDLQLLESKNLDGKVWMVYGIK